MLPYNDTEFGITVSFFIKYVVSIKVIPVII